MGDVQLGVLDGVVATKPGWIEKVEVVEVTFDPTVVAFETLLRQAETRQCATHVFTRTDAQQVIATKAVGDQAKRSDAPVRIEDDKYYAGRTALKALPMTPLQAAHVNAAVSAKKDFLPLLAPSQRALLKKIEASPTGWPSAIGVDFAAAWIAAKAHVTK